MLSAALLSALLALPQAPPARQPEPRPDWVDALPEAPGRIYALGMVDLGNSTGQSLAKASDRARVEVAARLRTSVKSQTVSTTRSTVTQSSGGPATGVSEKRFADTTAITVQMEDMPGLTVERTWLDPAGRAAYALAYLDVEQATRGVQERLETLATVRRRCEKEASRRIRWRLRQAQADLDQLEGQVAMLAPVGLSGSLRQAVTLERDRVGERLAQLEVMDLPPLLLSKMSLELRTNIDLSPANQDMLARELQQSGLRVRGRGADFILELSFEGGSKGPEFLFAEPQFFGSLLFRLEARLILRDSSGAILGRVGPISLVQENTASGLTEKFHATFRRRWTMLLDQLRAELE